MNISAIQNTSLTNITKLNHFTKSTNNVEKTKQYSQSKELYPLYYLPLSFKGSPAKSQEMLILENKLKKFCEENRGKNLTSVHVNIYPFQLTKSRMINGYFIEMVENTIDAEKRNKKLNKDIIKNALERGLDSYYNRINDVSTYEGYYSPEVINQKKHKEAERILDNIKDTNFDVKESSDEYYKISTQILEEIRELAPEIEDERLKNFAYRQFLEKFSEEITKNSINPILDNNIIQKLKTALSQEPFISFNEKMLKVEAQENASAVSAGECAESLYNDVINNNIAPFDNPKLYKYLKNHDESIDILIEKIYGYGCGYVNKDFEESGINEKHKILLVDPAIYLNFDKLVEFVNHNNIDTEDIEPFELRKGFSDYLGTETVYRGLYSPNPEELIKQLRKNGNQAHIFTDKEKTIESIKYYITNEYGGGSTYLSRIMDKIKSPNEANEYLSVTSIYDVAASVPKKSGNPKAPVVVIKTEVPKLSLIKQEGPVSNMQSSARHRYLKIGERRYSYDREQAKIEIFVPFYLPTNNAEYIIDTHTPNFEWRDW